MRLTKAQKKLNKVKELIKINPSLGHLELDATLEHGMIRIESKDRNTYSSHISTRCAERWLNSLT